MRGTDNDYDHDEGARPSSLISVRNLSTPDPLYDLQLIRELEIINARTRAELGPMPRDGVPVEIKRKPSVTTEQIEEDETMKIQNLAVVAALGVATAGGTFASEGTTSTEQSELVTHAATVSSDAKQNVRKSGSAKPKPKVNPEYMKIDTFSEFRKRIIADGWVPVPDPDCHDTILGGYYDEYCRDEPESISCRVCTLVPEIWRSTTDGYNLMRYTKEGVPLGVTVYGDLNDLDEPGRHGLDVVGWDYSEGINVILIEE